MTADDLLHNWARGEWHGEDPFPKAPNRCVSAERNYQIPHVMNDDVDYKPPINWGLHKLVHDYYRSLPLVSQRILQAEYTRRHEYKGLSKAEKHSKAARLLGISVCHYKGVLKQMKLDIESKWRNQ